MIRLGIASRLQMLRLRCFAQDDIPVRAGELLRQLQHHCAVAWDGEDVGVFEDA